MLYNISEQTEPVLWGNNKLSEAKSCKAGQNKQK
jgi:hypothetical protein